MLEGKGISFFLVCGVCFCFFSLLAEPKSAGENQNPMGKTPFNKVAKWDERKASYYTSLVVTRNSRKREEESKPHRRRIRGWDVHCGEKKNEIIKE